MNVVNFLLYLFFVENGRTLKILVYSPNFGFSHMNFMGRVADTLQLAGHNVTVLQPLILPEGRGTGCTHSKVITVPSIPEMKKDVDILASPDFWTQIWTANTNNPFAVLGPITLLGNLFRLEAENLLKQTELLESLRNEKFDVGITELFDFSAFPTFHRIGISNIVGAHTSGLFEGTALAVGVPTIPSYVPSSQATTGDSGSLWERFVNIIFTYVSYKFQASLLYTAQDVMNREMPDAPQIWDTMSNLSYILTNSDPMLDFPKPTLEKIIDLGGIGLRDSKPLDKEWSSILDLRSKTVLISFGSLAPSSTMPQAMKDNIMKVLQKFPDVTFIWKYETPEDGMGKGVGNVILTKWQPQTDLLADSRLSLFITHGGAGSVTESAYQGVPLITVPLFGDQMRNAQMVKRLGLGIYYHKKNLLDKVLFETTIRNALEDKGLRAAATRLRHLLSKRPFSPQEKLVKTIELAAEFGPMPNLAPNGRNLTFVQYFNLDILFYFSCTIIFTLLGIFYCLMSIVNTKLRVSSKKQD